MPDYMKVDMALKYSCDEYRSLLPNVSNLMIFHYGNALLELGSSHLVPVVFSHHSFIL